MNNTAHIVMGTEKKMVDKGFATNSSFLCKIIIKPYIGIFPIIWSHVFSISKCRYTNNFKIEIIYKPPTPPLTEFFMLG